MTNDPDNDIKGRVANLELQIADLQRMCVSLLESQRAATYRIDMIVDLVNMVELATGDAVVSSRSTADVLAALRAIIGGKPSEPSGNPPA